MEDREESPLSHLILSEDIMLKFFEADLLYKFAQTLFFGVILIVVDYSID